MTLGCDHVFFLVGEWSPLNKLFTLGGRLFNPPKGKHLLKLAESHRSEVNTLGILCDFSTFLRFLNGIHFRKSHTESERGDRSSPGKFLKLIEHNENNERASIIQHQIQATKRKKMMQRWEEERKCHLSDLRKSF